MVYFTDVLAGSKLIRTPLRLHKAVQSFTFVLLSDYNMIIIE